MFYTQLYYDIELAYRVCEIDEHPIDQMEKMGYKIIAGVPDSSVPCWWFTVEQDVLSDKEKPIYLKPFKYNYNYWHNKCYKTCDFFKKDRECCDGGFSCKKNEQ